MSITCVVHNLRKFFQGGEAHNGRGGGFGFAVLLFTEKNKPVPHGGKQVSPSSSGLRSLTLSLGHLCTPWLWFVISEDPPTLQCVHSVHRAAQRRGSSPRGGRPEAPSLSSTLPAWTSLDDAGVSTATLRSQFRTEGL